jgi:DNA uptake protein ComE-like DNA-binding protein
MAAILCASLCGIAQTQHGESSEAPKASVPAPDKRVDINHASINELINIPGMTQTWANRIVRYRPYRTKQDLLEKGILSGAVYDRIKDFVIAHRDKQ